MNTLLEELNMVGCYTDDHEDIYDGAKYSTPSILHDDGKETRSIGEEA